MNLIELIGNKKLEQFQKNIENKKMIPPKANKSNGLWVK